MKLFYKTQDKQIKDIITNVFRSGDYVVTVHYKKEAGVKFHEKHLAKVINCLKKGYQTKNKGLIFAGIADTQAVRLVVNADIELIEFIELLWDSMDCLQVNVLKTITQQEIHLAAEEMLKDTRKYIVVSEITRKIGRLWRESTIKELKRKSRFILKVYTPHLGKQNKAHK